MTPTATETPPAGAPPAADPVTPPAAPPAGSAPPPAADPPAPAAGDPPKPNDGTPPAAPPAAAGAPEKYELKLPADSKVDAAIVERTGTIARDLGLSQDGAQKTLEFVAKEVASQVEAQVQATIASHAKGGEAWKQQDEDWRTQSLADKVIGGTPEKLTASIGLAKQVLAKFGDQSSFEFLEASGLGSHPAALRLLVKIGKAMSEGSLVQPNTTQTEPTEQDKLERLYPSMKKKAA